MKTISFVSSRRIAAVALGLCQVPFSFSDHGDERSVSRPDSHAPIGVMGDHLHGSGEFMASYRRMEMRMEGHRIGENKLTTHQVFQRGFSAAAVDMDMTMDMFGVMYAPSDEVTLMLMANHMDMRMNMIMNPHAGMMGHGGHGMGGMSHSTSGWGDVSLTALVKAFESEGKKAHWNVGLSAPTGSVSEMAHGVFQPYGMQLGSGTWDAKVGATFAESLETFSWGAQALATIRLEDAGDSGFGRSNAMEASVWGAWLAGTNTSLSTRLKYSAEGALEGHYNGPHAHAAPPHFQANYGGDILEAIFGVNYIFGDGALRGNRIALEAAFPVYQQLNGVGMNREESITLGWQLAW